LAETNPLDVADAAREYADDKGTEKALAEATAKGWHIVDMKHDWNVIYPSVKK